MIYTAIYRQHILNAYATVELLFFREASSWVVWASLTLLSLITVVACCFIIMNYYQKVSLKLNHGSFFLKMDHISNYSYWVGCSCIYCFLFGCLLRVMPYVKLSGLSHFWVLRYSMYFGCWNEPLLKLPSRIIKVN